MSNISASDLIFSEQANHNFSRILGDLKRSNLSISNRLRSIRHDADFVDRVGSAFGRPLVANERCGSWYIVPKSKEASAYFKSTDGHTGQWKFSTRRLNLHLLSLISRHDGCIIVDSTRRGKSMPDALSKTVPIWCCVLNRVLFPDEPSFHELYVPPSVVSPSEHSQMLAGIPGFVESFKKLDMDISALRLQLDKPIRPLWVTQETQLVEVATAGDIFGSFHPVICCTSSRRVDGGTELGERGYIQGAADDTENWALGLTEGIFWGNIDRLLTTPEPELPSLLGELVASRDDNREPASSSSSLSAAVAAAGSLRSVTPHIYVGRLVDVAAILAREGPAAAVVAAPCQVLLTSDTTKADTWVQSPGRVMEVGIGKHKTASRNLRQALPAICAFVGQYLNNRAESAADNDHDDGLAEKRILVACETGRDICIGVALALMCYCFDDAGATGLRRPRDAPGFTKDSIRVRLGKIMTAMPEANPSRATLQSVNSFLMDWRS